MPTTNGRKVKHKLSHGTSFSNVIVPGYHHTHKIERLNLCQSAASPQDGQPSPTTANASQRQNRRSEG